MFSVDWEKLFVPTVPLLEILVRGTVIYWALFCAMRFLPRREVGGMGASDILVIVIIADAVQNGLSGAYQSVTEALILAAILFGWATLIDWLDYRFPQWHLAEAREVQIVRNGKLLRKAMARDNISEEEVLAHLRMHGVETVADVAAAYLEGNGRVSVILKGRRLRREAPEEETRRP